MAQPSSAPAPRFTDSGPRAMRIAASLRGSSAGLKYPRYETNAKLVTAIGAEKPAVKLTHPSMNPHDGPKRSDR